MARCFNLLEIDRTIIIKHLNFCIGASERSKMEPVRKLNLDAMSSPKMSSVSSWNEDKLEFIEVQDNEDFKTKICMPYFKDIYKDL